VGQKTLVDRNRRSQSPDSHSCTHSTDSATNLKSGLVVYAPSRDRWEPCLAASLHDQFNSNSTPLLRFPEFIGTRHRHFYTEQTLRMGLERFDLAHHSTLGFKHMPRLIPKRA
jgi:hypothetical protein